MNELTLFDPMMTLVAQNIKNREATPEESLIIDTAWVNAESSIRGLAYLSREGKTWKNISDKNGKKFTSFEAYGKERFDYEQAQLHRLANAFRVDSVLSFYHNDKKEIPLTQTMELNKLPDSAIPETYQAAIEKAREEGKKLGAKHVEEAVNEWKAKHESTQKQLENYQTMYGQASKQRDELRDNQQQIIEAKLNEERAKLVLENQQAIAENKRLADNAIAELERLKREQQKAIKDGVSRELSNLDREIELKQGQVDSYTKRIETLRNTELSLERSVGVLQTHKKCIEKIKDNLSFLTVSFHDAFDTNEIPTEVSGEWDAIFYAISKLKKQMAEWRDQCSPIESEALIGELVD